MPGHDYVKSGRLAVTDKTKPIYIYIYITNYIYIYIFTCVKLYTLFDYVH